MFAPIISSAEPRLLRYTLSDFNDPTKYNTRAAAANAAQQNTQHQIVLGEQLRQDLIDSGRQAQASLASGDINQQQFNDIMANNSRLAKSDSSSIIFGNEANAVKAGDNQQLANAQNVYANQDAGLASVMHQGVQNGQIVQEEVQTASDSELEQAAIDRLRSYGKTDQEIRQIISDPSFKANIRQTMSNTGLGGTARTSAVNFTPEQARQAQREAQLQAIVGYVPYTHTNPDGTTTTTYSIDDNATRMLREQAKNRFAQEDLVASNAKNQAMQSQNLRGLGDAFSQRSQVGGQPGGALDAITKATQGSPEGSIYSALANDLTTQKANELVALDEQRKAALANAEIDKKNTESYLTKTEDRRKQVFEEARREAETKLEENNKFLADREAIERERLQWQRLNETQKMERQKSEELLKDSISIALRGGGGSGAAMESLRSAEKEWDNAISQLQKEYAFKDSDISSRFTGLYVQAKQDYRSDLRSAMSDYRDALDKIDQTYYSSDAAYKKAKNNAKADYVKGVSEVNKDHEKTIAGLAKDVVSTISQKRDDEREQEKNGWDLLNASYDNYKKNIPPGILKRVSELTGVPVNELSQRVSQGAINGLSNMTTDPNSIFSGMTAQQVKEAVKRAFAPKNYGGTAGERAKRESEYLDRLARGESVDSIMQSLSSDYWTSQQGPNRTAHIERTTAQGSSETLQEYVDFYGIKAGDDGPLGRIDSKVQAFGSMFGLSSEEYNNLSNQVGNIRARIIKENYGAAVTPQELRIAQSYVPDMNDKGAMFVTKLQNLKVYQKYLDDKVTADALGLPMPKPPKPVTLSGDKVSGPSKYSEDDILSTINE